jgi:hypothetical protein
MTPAVLMAELLAVYCGWQFFDDGPLAFYVMMGLWVAWRMFLLNRERGSEWAPACLFGAWLGLMQAGCGAAYVADGRSFLCDKGTGLPVSSLVLAVAAGITAYYARRLYGRARD